MQLLQWCLVAINYFSSLHGTLLNICLFWNEIDRVRINVIAFNETQRGRIQTDLRGLIQIAAYTDLSRGIVVSVVFISHQRNVFKCCWLPRISLSGKYMYHNCRNVDGVPYLGHLRHCTLYATHVIDCSIEVNSYLRCLGQSVCYLSSYLGCRPYRYTLSDTRYWTTPNGSQSITSWLRGISVWERTLSRDII